ncbi:hypothetical protein AKO1_006300 [Acrasis kona]|uniref:Uncharacterized protein n=1 Tax=Acrasis kona TaxID=1008807 RepID=A0AAW2YIH6_9EUKA
MNTEDTIRQRKASIFITSSLCVIIYVCLCLLIAFVGTIDVSEYKPADCIATNTCFCEALRDIGTIRQPVSTWTNLFFTFYGLVEVVFISWHAPEGYKSLVIYALAQILHGLFSALYHETMIFSGQVIDNIGMYLTVGWLPSYCVERSLRMTLPLSMRYREVVIACVFWCIYMSIIAAGTIVNIWISWLGLVTFALTIAAALIIGPISDYKALFLDKVFQKISPNYKNPNLYSNRYKWMMPAAIVCFAIAFTFWLLDFFHVWCDPYGFYQGHGVWHALASSALFIMFLCYYTENFVTRQESTNKIPADDQTEQGLMSM